MYYLAVIYEANGLYEEANKLKPELESSSYELGPIVTQKNLKI
tara:strand:+ start:144371 stop:144499 length:129 start_codon:yes stop_codon:yes gene_type:complete